MIYSSARKLALSGWLKENGKNNAYNSPLKLQKFLFLYEMMSKAEGEKPDFLRLRGYKNGPVFSTVFGDYKNDRIKFDSEAEKAYRGKKQPINEDRAAVAAFIVETLTERELSDLTHQFNIWKAQEARIMNHVPQVDLKESDYNETDRQLILALASLYPPEAIKDDEIISIDQTSFVFSPEDVSKLDDTHYDTLWSLSQNEDLHNPVFVTIDEEGRLCVD